MVTASGFITANKAEDEDGDLNVDEDDEDLYGTAQYPYHVPCIIYHINKSYK